MPDNFAKGLSYFLNSLLGNIFKKLEESNLEYRNLHEENTKRFRKLKRSMAPKYRDMLTDYNYALHAPTNLENKYCYLCGLRDFNKSDANYNPVGDDIYKELAEIGKYTQLLSKRTYQRDELLAILPHERHDLLTQYDRTYDTISGLEKFYCYSCGMSDRARLAKQFDPANAAEWDRLLGLFL